MAKIDFYCPSCGETTKESIDYLAPGQQDFFCHNCLTAWEISIAYTQKPSSDDVEKAKLDGNAGRRIEECYLFGDVGNLITPINATDKP